MIHFDVDDNELNIDAIHDIQAVFIDQDEDIVLENEIANDALFYEDDKTNTIEEDDNIFVKNEVKKGAVDSTDDLTETEDEDSDGFVNNTVANDAVDSDDDRTTSKLPNNLTWIPLVYTTRLDEMNIFDIIEKYTPKEAAVLIQYESKPQYKQILPIKRKRSDIHSYSFMKLYSDIERLNQKVQTETKLRNEELMGMCKPLKIVLKDVKYDKTETTDSGSKSLNQINRKPCSTPSILDNLLKSQMAEKEVVKSVAKFQKPMSITINDSDDSDSLDDMPLITLKTCVNNSIEILPGSTTIAFIDKTSMKADIYILNKFKDLSCSYKTNAEKFILMKKTNTSTNTLVYDICCWVKREKQIKLLSNSYVAKENAISFMRIPHGCLHASCKCCCILKPPMPMQSLIKFLKMSNNKSDINTEANPLIYKSYFYSKKPQITKMCNVNETKSFLKSAVIMMKYAQTLVSQCNDLGENYEIGMEGDIKNHVKVIVNRSMTEERELHEKHDVENKVCRQYFSYFICCWYNREEIILNLSKDHNLSPTACKYLRNPHLCKSYNCRCCCKQAKIGLLYDEKNITALPQSKKHGKSIKEDNKKGQIALDKRLATKIKNSRKNKRKTVASENTVAIEGTNGNNKNSVCVMGSHYKPETEQTMSQTVQKPSIESQTTVAKTAEPPTESAKQITTIFDKFRDLKLSINDNGKLTANINTPPEKLLPVEIKVLADLLAQASNQMHELGIEPEEYCRRVNSKSLLINAANITLPPKLPIITHLSAILPQEPISPPPLCPIVKKTVKNTKDIIQPPQASKCVKQKSLPCKTHEISMNFPRTINSGQRNNLYSMMSQTGWVRNKRMVAAYNIHFDLEMVEEPAPQLHRTQSTNIEEPSLPKIVNVQSLVDIDTAPKTNTKPNRSKRKKKQSDKPESKGESCKIRVLPPERLSTLPISTQMNMIGLANLATLTKNVAKSIEPIPGHSQENLFDRNSSLNPIHNANGHLASLLPNASDKVVLTQEINSGPPTIHIPNSGKIWAYIDGKLVELQRSTSNAAAVAQNSIASNQNYCIPSTETMNLTPMITVSNGIPMQISRLCADGDTEVNEEDAQAPTVNEETQESAMNSLLRDMLSKESSLPNLPQSIRKHNRYSNALKRTVTPLIIAHSKELQLKRRRVQDDPIVSNPKENLENVVSIPIIDSDEEEESIFGV